MPIPKPQSGESDRDFMSRCMADDAMQEYPREQRVAVCMRQTEGAKMLELDQELLADDLDAALRAGHRDPTGQFAFGGKSSAKREANKMDYAVHATKATAVPSGPAVSDINSGAAATAAAAAEGLSLDVQPIAPGTDGITAAQAGASQVADLHVMSGPDVTSSQAARMTHRALGASGYSHVAHYAHDDAPDHTNYYEKDASGVALRHDASPAAATGQKIKMNGRAYDASKRSMTTPAEERAAPKPDPSPSDMPDCPKCGTNADVKPVRASKGKFVCTNCGKTWTDDQDGGD